jgi:hypothetical protein
MLYIATSFPAAPWWHSLPIRSSILLTSIGVFLAACASPLTYANHTLGVASSNASSVIVTVNDDAFVEDLRAGIYLAAEECRSHGKNGIRAIIFAATASGRGPSTMSFDCIEDFGRPITRDDIPDRPNSGIPEVASSNSSNVIILTHFAQPLALTSLAAAECRGHGKNGIRLSYASAGVWSVDCVKVP